MLDDFNWAIGGEAGDGIDSTGKIFARSLSRSGRHVYTSKDFASRIRGGYTAYKVRSAIEPVRSVVDRLDVLVALTQRTIDENRDELHSGSVVIYDGERTMMQDVQVPDEVTSISVPLTSLAEEAGGRIMKNVVALGASCAVSGLPLGPLEGVLESHFGGKGDQVVEGNVSAGRHGHRFVVDEFDAFDYDLETTDADYVLLNGAEAIGMGIIAAGCRFYAGYPITPATYIMHYLVGRIDRYGGHVVQAEDELAAINLALGAARTGARAATATSGPGIDLMCETIGLAAASETPLVIVDMMRAGPSSGMATKQEQSDLNMLLHGGHGEAPWFVVAPTTVTECFWKTVEAFNLADRYQTPVFLAGDLALAVTEQTVSADALDLDAVEIDRGKLVDSGDVDRWHDEQGRFRAHAVTDDGISPRALPGTSGAAHMSTGLEHDELGRRTEDPRTRIDQMNKRARKLQTASEREDWSYREFGDPDAGVLIISWGSNEGAILEAMAMLAEEGLSVRFASVPYLLPRPDLTDEIETADSVLVVECNSMGQFADLLEHDTLTRVDRILKYSGVRFTADELAEKIRERVAEGQRA